MIEEMYWDDLTMTRWEQIPFKHSLGLPYSQYINHSGWVYKYTFSYNVSGGFLVMKVIRLYDNREVFHGRLNPWDYVKARDPVYKCQRFLWMTRQLDIDKENVVIYVFYQPDSWRGPR